MVNTLWSQLDFEKNERTKFQRTYVFDTQSETPRLINSGKPLPIRNKYLINICIYIGLVDLFFSIQNRGFQSLWNVKSPDNVLNAIVTSWKDGGEDKQLLEVENLL